MNLPQKAIITGNFLTLDGGSYGVYIIDENNDKHTITLTQRCFRTKEKDDELESGRLYFNKKKIDVRSHEEVAIISLLKNAEYSDSEYKDEIKKGVHQLINDISSDAYVAYINKKWWQFWQK